MSLLLLYTWELLKLLLFPIINDNLCCHLRRILRSSSISDNSIVVSLRNLLKESTHKFRLGILHCLHFIKYLLLLLFLLWLLIIILSRFSSIIIAKILQWPIRFISSFLQFLSSSSSLRWLRLRTCHFNIFLFLFRLFILARVMWSFQAWRIVPVQRISPHIFYSWASSFVLISNG